MNLLDGPLIRDAKDDKRSAGIQPPAIGGKIAITS